MTRPGPAVPIGVAHPFADHLGLRVAAQAAGASRTELTVSAEHLNPHGVVHGAVLFALADTGMGAALYPTLDAGESCATIDIQISFLRGVTEGVLHCETTLVHRGRTVAHLVSRVFQGERAVASATGNFAIVARRAG